MRTLVAVAVAAGLLAGCGRSDEPGAVAPPDPPDSPRIATCKALVQRVSGSATFGNVLELPTAGGTVAMDVAFTTPAGSPAEERVTCHFEGEDEVQLFVYGSTLQPPPQHWRARLDEAGVNYLKGR